MGALVNALRGSELDTGLEPSNLLLMDSYWEQVRLGGEGRGLGVS
jgi:pyruvate carboxylase